uniref:PhoH-like protein n=1 Tax=viral metagenome TaxID=1070528 RepID=A0A6C0D3M1_9ZZZZ
MTNSRISHINLGRQNKIIQYYKNKSLLYMKNGSQDVELGIEPIMHKKRGRKSKKQNEKEIMYQYAKERDQDREHESVKASYENMQYFSQAEKKKFEDKYTIPKNESQEIYVNILRQKSKKIVVATGPAGTGKTLFATEFGIRNFLLGTYEKLIFTRPSVSVDEELGFLPGTLEEKMAPWVRPIYDVLYNFISPKEVTSLMEDKVIEIAPLGYMRGRTFKNCWIVADEMQNSTVSQMKMLMTRLGENSRLVITGDLEQYDRTNELNGLDDFLNKFRGRRSSSISSFEFRRSDIQREEVVKEVLDIYGGDIPADYREFETENTEILENKLDIVKNDIEIN